MHDIVIDIDEIEDLESPVAIHGAAGEPAGDMVADISVIIAIALGGHPAP